MEIKVEFILNIFEDPKSIYDKLFKKEIEINFPFLKNSLLFPRFIGYLETEKSIFYFNDISSSEKKPSCMMDILKKIDCLGKIKINLKEYKMDSIEKYRDHRKNCVMRKTKTIYKIKKDKDGYHCLCTEYYLCICKKRISNSKSYLCKSFNEKEEINSHILSH